MSRSKTEYFNKIIEDCADKIEMDQKSEGNYHYNTVKEYHDSLKSELGSFKLTEEQKKSIDVIFFKGANLDGYMSATIVNHYLNENGKQPLIFGVGSGVHVIKKKENFIRDKNVILLDLNYSKKEDYETIEKMVKTLIVIDDHPPTDYKSSTFFTSNNGHGTCGIVWAVFYPKKPVPLLVQIIDTIDSAKYAKYISHGNFITSAIMFRYIKNPYKSHEYYNKEVFQDLWNLAEGGKEKMLAIIGNYMSEVQENIKEQIARNAVIKDFQGYKVGVLNFGDPVLYKRVGLQINSNLNRKGRKIDFAVLFNYEMRNEMYKVSLIDDRKQTKVDLGNLARKLGTIGGTKKGGGGHKHSANFYWPNKPGMNIFDLFKKKYI